MVLACFRRFILASLISRRAHGYYFGRGHAQIFPARTLRRAAAKSNSR